MTSALRLFSGFTVLASLALTLLAPLPATAVDPLQRACGGGGQASQNAAACQNGGGEDPIAGPNGIIPRATNIVAFVAGIAVIIFLVVAGLKYITSQGDPGEVSKAKQSIIYAIIGLVLIFLGRTIINFVISRI